ncbi:MAG: hypothetical protein ACTJHC_03485 [Vagococcus sp.]
MAKKKVVAPFLKPIAILSISVTICATTAVIDSKSYKTPKPEKIESTLSSSTNQSKEPNDKKIHRHKIQ